MLQKKELAAIIEEGNKAMEEATKGLNPFRDREKFTEAATSRSTPKPWARSRRSSPPIRKRPGRT